jgi:gamma-glutamyltranspeptidase / glutathione hydrolase
MRDHFDFLRDSHRLARVGYINPPESSDFRGYLMFTTRPEIAGDFGVAASTHWAGTQVAMAVLERGGNAFDAAVAAAFTLQVVEPHLNGPGGDVPAIIHCASTKTQHVVCGQAGAPQAATIEQFDRLGLDQVPGTGLLPTVIPGSFDAWCLILRNWGTWEFPDVIAYALEYARKGMYVLGNIAAAIESVRPMFETEWPSSAAVFLPGGRAPKEGERFARPKLVEVWERLKKEAVGPTREARINAVRAAWYTGFVAEAIDQFFRTSELMDVTGRRNRGFLCGDDLANWQAEIEDPVNLEVRSLEPRAGFLAAAGPIEGLRHRQDGCAGSGLRPYTSGVRKARFR